MPKQRTALAPVTHRVRTGGIRRVYVAALAPSLLAACSGDVVSLGERQDEIAVPPHSRCQTSTTLEGPVRIESQEQLDTLEGCEIIAGDLDIVAFPTASLRSLHALTRVEGRVKIGGYIPVRPTDGERPVEESLHGDRAAYEASIVSWLPSLEGLEQLETVGSLAITAPVRSLQPLSGLRRIDTRFLNVSSPVLESLAGLEAIGELEHLGVQGGKLRDISAVRLSEEMESLSVHAPILALDASALREAEHISLAYTELEDLDTFENLGSVDSLTIVSNARLRNVDGLGNVRYIVDLTVAENGQLESLGGAFPLLYWLRTLQIGDNPILTELPSFPSFDDGTGLPVPDDGPEWRSFINMEFISLHGNDRLQHFTMPAKWRTATTVAISGTLLETIDFANMQSIGTLIVEANPLLSGVNLGALSSVAFLDLNSNDVLSPTVFDGVSTVERNIARNAPAP